MYKSICVLLLSVGVTFCSAQTPSPKQWVDSIYNTMTLDEKVGQLFMVRAYSKADNKDVGTILSQIEKYHIGGICFFQGSPTKQAELTNKYQKKSKVPLLISIDGEWGLGMRFKDDAISFPRQLMLGAVQDNNIIYEMGQEVARQLKRIGVHVNFAPVVDVNNNPANPVINDRSFGEDKYNVIAKSYAYMKGMQDMGVMACMKHFPGHGDTDVDSHYDLPIINHSRGRLDSLEILPFKALVKQGISSTMVAHLHIPAIDDRANRPTTLSKPAVTDILRTELSFSGLIYTDAMDMKGVTKHFPDGEADLEAFAAGVDVLLLPNDLAKGIKAIKEAVASGKISEDRLAYSVKKILSAKHSVGLAKPVSIDLNGIADYVNSNRAHALKSRLIEQAVTLARDDERLVPIREVANLNMTTIAIGAEKETPFQKMISRYASVKHQQVSKKITETSATKLLGIADKEQTVVVSFHDMSKYSKTGFGIDTSALQLLRQIDATNKLIVVVFGSPYALSYFDEFTTVLAAYNEEEITQEIVAQALFGTQTIKGRLPVTSSTKYKNGQGIYRESLGRLGFSIPERVGMSSRTLAKLDDLAAEMISKGAAPGGQMLVARQGKIVLHKAYGHHTYKKEREARTNDIYDVASITKICATTISLMKLYDDGKFDLNASLSRYLGAEVDTCNKRDLNVRSMLAHHARLRGWIPFYTETVSESKKNPKPLEKYYRKIKDETFSVKVANDLYMRADYQDSIWSRIYASDLSEDDEYRYSDLSFYIFHKIIQNITNEGLDQYADQTFYKSLGLRRTGFVPMERHSRYEVAPTEEDLYFRKQRLQGHVHDMGAAMMGGVAGHAGLFSNAYDLSVILQMLLNKGNYGGTQYLKPSTVKTFTTRYHASTRRGLGFDMKELDSNKTINMSEMASASTFGHLGFTGISAFADPEYDLIFIFITNRTYPSMNNRKFARGDYRPKAQTIVYQSMMDNVAHP